jgi:hypothetical protein
MPPFLEAVSEAAAPSTEGRGFVGFDHTGSLYHAASPFPFSVKATYYRALLPHSCSHLATSGHYPTRERCAVSLLYSNQFFSFKPH